MPKTAVVDTSCFIAFSALDLLDLLCNLYDEIIIPAGVLKEFGDLKLPCLKIETVNNPLVDLLIHEANLGRGESEVIALAHETGKFAVIDDQKARHVAKEMGIKITGTIGLLLKAKEKGIIDSVYERVLELKNKGFYVSDSLLAQIREK